MISAVGGRCSTAGLILAEANWLEEPDAPGSWEAQYAPIAVEGNVAVAQGRTRYLLPDGTQIAFKSERDGNREIYLMRADGSGQANLSQAPVSEDTFPVWSPDGQWLAFSSERTTGFGLYLIRADGSALTFLTEGAMPGWGP